MAQPLTDAIQALTRYANEVTGQSDQTLSDAVRTLCDGYGGGGIDWDVFASGAMPAEDIVLNTTSIRYPAFYGFYFNTRLIGNSVTTVAHSAFRESSFTAILLPSATTATGSGYVFYGCYQAKVIDIGSLKNAQRQIGGWWFASATQMDDLIIRSTTMIPLDNINAFYRTKARTTGQTLNIYIPKVLYDHIGDGSANDYLSNANWSSSDLHITWQQIEGSKYENLDWWKNE